MFPELRHFEHPGFFLRLWDAPDGCFAVVILACEAGIAGIADSSPLLRSLRLEPLLDELALALPLSRLPLETALLLRLAVWMHQLPPLCQPDEEHGRENDGHDSDVGALGEELAGEKLLDFMHCFSLL